MAGRAASAVAHCASSARSPLSGPPCLRGLAPRERAETLIDRCAHPDYRELLRNYLNIVEGGHTPHTLSAAFRMHEHFQQTGDMHGCCWDTVQSSTTA